MTEQPKCIKCPNAIRYEDGSYHGCAVPNCIISSWNIGIPTEEGWYLIKYKCIYQSQYYGQIIYGTMRIYTDNIGYKAVTGMPSDSIWKAIEYQKIDNAYPFEIDK